MDDTNKKALVDSLQQLHQVLTDHAELDPALTVSSPPSLSLRSLVKSGISKRTDFPLIRSKTALLIIDVQEWCNNDPDVPDEYHPALTRMLNNISKMLPVFRHWRDHCENNSDKTTISSAENGNTTSGNCTITGCEVIFCAIQSMTNDGRDVSLDYKLSGPSFVTLPKVHTPIQEVFPKQLQPDLHTGKGDIVITKTACNVFTSTNIDYILRNLHVEQLVMCGQYTEQCVESAVRNAADLGYFVTVVEDACASPTQDRHYRGLQGMKGFCRIISTDQVLTELNTAKN